MLLSLKLDGDKVRQGILKFCVSIQTNVFLKQFIFRSFLSFFEKLQWSYEIRIWIEIISFFILNSFEF